VAFTRWVNGNWCVWFHVVKFKINANLLHEFFWEQPWNQFGANGLLRFWNQAMKFSFGIGTTAILCLGKCCARKQNDFTSYSNESWWRIMSEYDKLLSDKTKVVTVNPFRMLLELSIQLNIWLTKHMVRAFWLMEQAVPIWNQMFRNWIVILCFSGHKICGPTGTGILYGRG
jgi:hypothetical protein